MYIAEYLFIIAFVLLKCTSMPSGVIKIEYSFFLVLMESLREFGDSSLRFAPFGMTKLFL